MGVDDEDVGDFNGKWTVDRLYGEVWCVSGPSAANGAQMNCPLNASSARPEKILKKRFPSSSQADGPHMCNSLITIKRAGRVFSSTLSDQATNPSVLTVPPGDICIIFHPRNSHQCDLLSLFVASFLTHFYGFPPERLVWITKQELLQDLADTGDSLPVVSEIILSESPTLNPISGQHSCNGNRPKYPSYVYPADGASYLVYCFML